MLIAQVEGIFQEAMDAALSGQINTEMTIIFARQQQDYTMIMSILVKGMVHIYLRALTHVMAITGEPLNQAYKVNACKTVTAQVMLLLSATLVTPALALQTKLTLLISTSALSGSQPPNITFYSPLWMIG